jgi:hypothetical protein
MIQQSHHPKRQAEQKQYNGQTNHFHLVFYQSQCEIALCRVFTPLENTLLFELWKRYFKVESALPQTNGSPALKYMRTADKNAVKTGLKNVKKTSRKRLSPLCSFSLSYWSKERPKK